MTAPIGALLCSVCFLGAGFPTATEVPPKKWATSVCKAVATWVDIAKDGSTELQSNLAGVTDADVLVTSVAEFLSDLADGADAVVTKIKKAGVPDTPKGKKAQKALIAGAAFGDLSKLDPGNMLDRAFSKVKACRALG